MLRKELRRKQQHQEKEKKKGGFRKDENVRHNMTSSIIAIVFSIRFSFLKFI